MKKLLISTLLLSALSFSAHADFVKNQQLDSAAIAKYSAMNPTQLEPSAKVGDAAAQFYLGLRYKLGQGVAKNPTQAFNWFKKAADQGIKEAQLNVGQMYASGEGVKQDINSAKTYLMKSAKQGENKASYVLAMIEERSKNYANAYQWYDLSTRDGMVDYRVKDLSEKKIVQLAANLSSNDIRLARERADQWIQAD